MDYALVLAHGVAVGVIDRAGCAFAGFKETAIVAAADEILAFRQLRGLFQPGFYGDIAHLLFGQSAEREHKFCKLRLSQSPEKIGLVLFFVDAFFKQIFSAGIFYAGIVSGGKKIELAALLAGPLDKQSELYQPVAAHAGIGCASGEIFCAEIIQHSGFVFRAQINGMM